MKLWKGSIHLKLDNAGNSTKAGCESDLCIFGPVSYKYDAVKGL